MGILFSILFIALIVMLGAWLLKVVVFGIGLGIMLAVIGLAAILFASISFSGSLTFLLYLLIKVFMIIFVVSLIGGIIFWIKDTVVSNN